jgi:hypothetical protein
MNYDDDVKSTIKMRLFNSFNAEKPSFKARKERPDERSTKFVLSERKDTTGVKTDELFHYKHTSSEASLSREEEDAHDDDECTSLSVYSSHYVCYRYCIPL